MKTIDRSRESSLIQRTIDAIIIFFALSVSLPIAWISLGKILLVTLGILFISVTYLVNTSARRFFNSDMLMTSKVALVSVIAFGLSIFYSQVDSPFAWHAFIKHCKILVFPLLVYFIHDRRGSVNALSAFLIAQCALITCSWLLYFGIPLLWDPDTPGKNVVFSSYLDQSIMFTVDAALLWHLRKDSVIPFNLSIFFALAAIGNVFFLLEGRTGYVTALAVVGLTVMWALPRRLQLAGLILTPILLVSVLFASSTQIQNRLSQIVAGASEFSTKFNQNSSEGWRLNAWNRSVQAISVKPYSGYGVGSWTYAAKKMEGEQGANVFGNNNSSNPHQEYLLWGVELGLTGIFLLCAFFASAAWEARHFPPSIGRSCWSVLVVIAIACLFNSSLYDDLIGDYLCVALGLTMALGVTHSSRANDS